jgi:hypothetical protein
VSALAVEAHHEASRLVREVHDGHGDPARGWSSASRRRCRFAPWCGRPVGGSDGAAAAGAVDSGRRSRVVALLMAALVAGAFSCTRGRGELDLPLTLAGAYRPSPLQATEGTVVRDLSHFGFDQPVSVAVIDERHVAVANYQQVIVVDWHSGERIVVPPPVPHWVPVGLAWHEPTRRLFVANYKAANIVVLGIGPDLTIRSVRELRHPAMVGPEGVAVSLDGSRIGVADHDGDAVMVFDGDGVLLERHAVGLPHGIVFDDERRTFFATGLVPPRLFEFSADGALLRQIGETGWGPLEFLWPTTVAISPSGAFAVADAHSGEITLHAPGELNERASVGGNGPDLGRLNMPYGIAWQKDLMWVTDTFRSRLLLVSPTTKTLHQVLLVGKLTRVPDYARLRFARETGQPMPIWSHPPGEAACSIPDAEIHARGTWDSWTDVNRSIDLPLGPAVPQVPWNCSYASFRNSLDGQQLWLRSVSLLTGSYYYFIEAWPMSFSGRELVVFGSPQNNCFLVAGDGLVTSIELAGGLWLRPEGLCNEHGHVPLEAIAAWATSRFDRFRTAILQSAPRAWAIREFLMPEAKALDFDDALDQVFGVGHVRQLVAAALSGDASASSQLAAYREQLASASVIDGPQLFLLNAILY